MLVRFIIFAFCIARLSALPSWHDRYGVTQDYGNTYALSQDLNYNPDAYVYPPQYLNSYPRTDRDPYQYPTADDKALRKDSREVKKDDKEGYGNADDTGYVGDQEADSERSAYASSYDPYGGRRGQGSSSGNEAVTEATTVRSGNGRRGQSDRDEDPYAAATTADPYGYTVQSEEPYVDPYAAATYSPYGTGYGRQPEVHESVTAPSSDGHGFVQGQTGDEYSQASTHDPYGDRQAAITAGYDAYATPAYDSSTIAAYDPYGGATPAANSDPYGSGQTDSYDPYSSQGQETTTQATADPYGQNPDSFRTQSYDPYGRQPDPSGQGQSYGRDSGYGQQDTTVSYSAGNSNYPSGGSSYDPYGGSNRQSAGNTAYDPYRADNVEQTTQDSRSSGSNTNDGRHDPYGRDNSDSRYTPAPVETSTVSNYYGSYGQTTQDSRYGGSYYGRPPTTRSYYNPYRDQATTPAYDYNNPYGQASTRGSYNPYNQATTPNYWSGVNSYYTSTAPPSGNYYGGYGATSSYGSASAGSNYDSGYNSNNQGSQYGQGNGSPKSYGGQDYSNAGGQDYGTTPTTCIQYNPVDANGNGLRNGNGGAGSQGSPCYSPPAQAPAPLQAQNSYRPSCHQAPSSGESCCTFYRNGMTCQECTTIQGALYSRRTSCSSSWTYKK